MPVYKIDPGRADMQPRKRIACGGQTAVPLHGVPASSASLSTQHVRLTVMHEAP